MKNPHRDTFAMAKKPAIPIDNKNKPTEWLDLWVKFLTFVSTTVIAVMAFQLNSKGEASKSNQNALDTIIKVIALNASEKQAEQNAGQALMSELSNDEFLSTFFPNFSNSTQIKNIINRLREQVYTQGVAIKPVLPINTIQSSGNQKNLLSGRWVYIGQYDKANNRWDTKYLVGMPNDSDAPESLIGKTLKVNRQTGALNVRSGPATETSIAPVIDVIPPGQDVTIEQVQSAGKNPHYWGKLK